MIALELIVLIGGMLVIALGNPFLGVLGTLVIILVIKVIAGTFFEERDDPESGSDELDEALMERARKRMADERRLGVLTADHPIALVRTAPGNRYWTPWGWRISPGCHESSDYWMDL